MTKRSRTILPASFLFQKARLPVGILQCFGQPCQKQPSTNKTNRCLQKVKSGFPKIGRCRRQPVILFCRNRRMSAISVALLPRPRIRDMTSERFALLKTSGICVNSCDPCLGFASSRLPAMQVLPQIHPSQGIDWPAVASLAPVGWTPACPSPENPNVVLEIPCSR